MITDFKNYLDTGLTFSLIILIDIVQKIQHPTVVDQIDLEIKSNWMDSTIKC